VNLRFGLYYLAALLLLFAAGIWLVWQNWHKYQNFELFWLLPLAALLISAIAIGHILQRTSAWVMRSQKRLQCSSAQLKEARQAHQALLEHSNLIICTLDGKGRYMSMNRYGLDILGVEFSEIEGKYFEEHLDSAGAARMRGMLQTALLLGQAAQNLEPLNLAGQERFLEIHMKSLESTLPSNQRVLLLMRDRTEQKLFEQRMWQTEKLASLGLLAAGVAHQINNPLGILMGFCQLLRDGSSPDAPGQRELGIILEQGAECKRIVDGLLSFTRLGELGGGRCDLLGGLHSVLDTVRPVLESKGIVLILNLPPALPECRAKDSSMQQVFLNLIANAMDAMPEGGELMISAGLKNKEPMQGSMHGTLPESHSYVQISFQDSGPGIPEENLERIYDPFFTTKPVGKGTGLGLSVAYGIVSEHGGTIIAQPQVSKPGQEEGGACFIIRLPVLDEAGFRERPTASG
jgi:two-component system NtrC family sensor kinase